MKQRVISILMVSIIVVPLFVIGKIYFDIGLCILAIFGLKELLNLEKNEKIIKVLTYLSMLLIIICDKVNIGIEKAITISILLNYLPIIFYDKEKYNFNMACNNFSKSLLLGYSFYLFRLYRTEDMWIMLFLFVISASTDVFAYIIGYYFGKRKISPKVSPKKTVEGSISGSLFGVIISSIFYVFFVDPAANLSIIILILILSIMGQLGDLFFSQIKRNNEIKDFSDLIPGHGGILDRFDSLIFITLAYTLLASLF